MAGGGGSKNNAETSVHYVLNAQTPSGFFVQVQARGGMEMFDDSDFVILNMEVTLLGPVHFETIFNVLVDAVGGVRGVALAVG